jgi:hypothetical protein
MRTCLGRVLLSSLSSCIALSMASCGGAPQVVPHAVRDPHDSAGTAKIAPEWVINGLSDAHPDAQWLQAVGSAEIGASVQDARERAEFKARAALVRNLSSTVRSLTESHELFEANDSQSRLQVSLEQTIAVVGEGTLEGARPLEFYVEEPRNTAHCLLVLERAPAAREVARRIAVKEADAAALLARAKTAREGPALLTLCEAYDHVLAARLLRVSYAVLARGPGIAPDTIGDAVLAALQGLCNELSLHVDAGQSQRARVGQELPTPIVVQLRNGAGRGIDGVPLLFRLLGTARAELAPNRQTTASEGRAAFFVRAIGASGQRSNQIEASIEALAVRSWSGPRVTVEYLLPTAQDTRVAVVATAQAHGESADPTQLLAGVVGALARAGFNVVPSASLDDRVAAAEWPTAVPTLLCQRLRGAVDFVVRVTGTAADAARRGERLRARASGVVTVIDVGSGAVDQFLSDPADGIADTHVEAAALGLQRLGVSVGSAAVRRLQGMAGL